MKTNPPEAGGDFTYTCGYFNPVDLYADMLGSNQMDVVNMNLYWSGGYFITSSTMITTLVHEFQHLINESNRRYLGGTAMDVWLDEGLAQGAEQLCYSVLTDRVDQFNADSDYPSSPDADGATSYYIRNGASLVVWDDGEYGDYADYAMSYLFMQYARLQCSGDEGIYKELITHAKGDYRSITAVMKSRSTGFDDFSDVVSGFYLANLLQQSSGKYGYYGQFALSVNSPTKSVSKLLPSSALYIKSDMSSIESTLRIGAQGDNVGYYLAVDGEVYAVEDGKWTKQ